ncbi:MAG: DUF3626 domain-containing protein [Nocardioides sp.]|uniref:DUF3626 domain-containing protein n=1 Tax=Nocardioides sp. TaxID=35761 RepID=UPI003266C1DC
MSITLHFHPDWPHGGGLVIEAMGRAEGYHNQFVTGVSNGLLAPTEGSDRWKWESRLFDGRYDVGAPADRPVYGSWTRRSDAYGGSPRFGSACFRLRPEVAGRATYCYPDSTFDPMDFGGPDRLEALCRLADAAPRDDPLDDYVEAQVHGGVRFDCDVEALALDPCHASGRVRRRLNSWGAPLSSTPATALRPRTCRSTTAGPSHWPWPAPSVLS